MSPIGYSSDAPPPSLPVFTRNLGCRGQIRCAFGGEDRPATCTGTGPAEGAWCGECARAAEAECPECPEIARCPEARPRSCFSALVSMKRDAEDWRRSCHYPGFVPTLYHQLVSTRVQRSSEQPGILGLGARAPLALAAPAPGPLPQRARRRRRDAAGALGAHAHRRRAALHVRGRSLENLHRGGYLGNHENPRFLIDLHENRYISGCSTLVIQP